MGSLDNPENFKSINHKDFHKVLREIEKTTPPGTIIWLEDGHTKFCHQTAKTDEKVEYTPNFIVEFISCMNFLRNLSVQFHSKEYALVYMLLVDLYICFYYEVIIAIKKRDPFTVEKLGIKHTNQELETIGAVRNTVFHVSKNSKSWQTRREPFMKFINSHTAELRENINKLVNYAGDLTTEYPFLKPLWIRGSENILDVNIPPIINGS